MWLSHADIRFGIASTACLESYRDSVIFYSHDRDSHGGSEYGC